MASWKHLAIGGGSMAVAAGAAYLLFRKRSDVDVVSTPETEEEAGTPADKEAADKLGGEGNPPPISDNKWANVPVAVQRLLTDIQAAADLPYLWVMGSIIAQREASFIPTAHNTSQKEVDGSRDGLKNGLSRGNPRPKFAAEIEKFGSGGYFGALSPYFAWIGLDAGFMPFLNRRPELVFDAKASGVFLAHYYYRITSPNYVKNRTMDMFDVRVGWASPSLLKNDPFGTYAQGVRKRMRESIAAIGWDEEWIKSLPVVRARYKGIQAVSAKFGFDPKQAD